MVVAGPRLPQRRVARANRKMLARRLQFGRDLHDPLDHVGNARRRQPVIAVPSLLGDGQKAALRHARQMPACSLRRDPGHAREFGRRQGAALHQRVKHRRAAGIARHRGDFGKGCRTGHRLCFPPVGNHNAPFTGDASVLAVASLRALPVLGGAEKRTGDGDDIDGFRKIPWMARCRRGFRAGRVRLGPRVLRSADLSAGGS